MSSTSREKITQGISLLFKTQWTALKLAVDMQWGGHDSEDKRDWLIDVIVKYFDESNVFIFIYLYIRFK
jgi:pre-rRNA-processing protein TSR2